KELGSYFEAKEGYAAVLDEYLGRSNPNWRVIPIYGPIYKPGAVLSPGSTEPLTDDCIVPEDSVIIDPMASFPRVTASRSFDLGGTIPGSVAKAKDLAISGGASFGSTAEAVLDYKELSQHAVRRDVFDENLLSPDCLMAIAGTEVMIVRGQIVGKETISSTRTLATGANVTVLGDEALTLSYDSSGGFALEDLEAQPKYFYVVNRTIEIDGVLPNASPTMRRAAIHDFLRSESTTDLDYIDSRPSDDQVESLLRATNPDTE
ncbi:MAG: hypothetical protein AAFY56_23900, partial [Pseudomonadota bacterium]